MVKLRHIRPRTTTTAQRLYLPAAHRSRCASMRFAAQTILVDSTAHGVARNSAQSALRTPLPPDMVNLSRQLTPRPAQSEVESRSDASYLSLQKQWPEKAVRELRVDVMLSDPKQISARLQRLDLQRQPAPESPRHPTRHALPPWLRVRPSWRPRHLELPRIAFPRQHLLLPPRPRIAKFSLASGEVVQVRFEPRSVQTHPLRANELRAQTETNQRLRLSKIA